MPYVGNALKDLLSLKSSDEEKIEKMLKEILEHKRGKLSKVEMENLEYDEEFAKIGNEAEEAGEKEGQDG